LKLVDFKGFPLYNGGMENVVLQAAGPHKPLAEIAFE
jgi:hypothetical protein